MCQKISDIDELESLGMPKRICKLLKLKLLKKMEIDSNFCKCGANDELINDKIDKCEYCIEMDKKLNKTRHNESTYTDILAIFTYWTRIMVVRLEKFGEKLTRTAWFKILTKTTQPAHVIAVGILSLVLLAIWPNLLASDSNPTKSDESKLTLVIYLGAFATHFGAQIWMTFISGLSLYFALPRHTFGLCQQILFPKYFALNSILSICTLIMYIKVIGRRWEFSSCVQVASLTLCAAIEVVVRLYLAPPLLRLMREKHKLEIAIGSGQEVGHLDQKDLTKCPHYQRIHKAFRQVHMTVAMGNMTVLVCTFLHLNYLASKINVS